MNFPKLMVIMMCLVVLSLSFSCVSATDYSIEKGITKFSNNEPVEYMSLIKIAAENKPVSVEGVYCDNEEFFYFIATNADSIANIPLDGLNPDLTVGDMFGINELLFNDYLNHIDDYI